MNQAKVSHGSVLGQRIRELSRAGSPYLILGAGLVITALATLYFVRNTEMADQLRFRNEVLRVRSNIEGQIETCIALLQASRGFFYANSKANRADFHTYIESLDIRHRYPGLQGIGLAVRAVPGDIKALEAGARAEGVPDFTVAPAGIRNEYYVIVFLEPLDERNKVALGFDMYSEEVRRLAMSQACDTGAAVASGKVILRQEIDDDRQAGFLIYLPIYQDADPQNVAARQSNIVGFVYSPFRAGDFFSDMLRQTPLPSLNVEVYDGDGVEPNALLYRSPGSAVAVSHFTTQERLNIAGRNWTLNITTRPEFDAGSRRSWTPILAGSGVAFSLLLFTVFLVQARARAEAEARARALRAAERAQSELLKWEQSARQSAEEANRAKDEFLAVVSHELRTPLNAIVGWTHILRSGTLKPEAFARAVGIIERNARAQLRLTEDLLDFAGLNANQIKLQPRTVDVSDLVTTSLATVQPDAEAKDVALVENTDPQAGKIYADPERLQQALWNLLSNAIKFTPPGGTVTLSATRQDEYLEFIVSDTGQGISQEFLPHVFDRFSQEDTATTRQQSGMGLGLAIVRQLVELHGGGVTALSTGKGSGARFIIRLPLALQVNRP